MPKRIRVTRKGRMGGGSDKRSLDFRERQRQKSREQAASLPTRRKKQERPIPSKPFKEIPELSAVDLSDYYYPSRTINGIISPGKGLEKAVHCFMINMLLNCSDIYQAGKSYSRRERQYTRAQLEVFAESLSAL